MARPKQNDVSSRLEMRFDERLRYLSEIAARTMGMTYRDYLEWAVERSFSEVDLRQSSQRPRPSFAMVNGQVVVIDPTNDDAGYREKQRICSLEHWKMGLWQDTPFKRLISLKTMIHALQKEFPDQKFDHILTPVQERIWKFLWSNDACVIKTTGRLNERYIEENWLRIRNEALGGKVPQ